MTRLALMAFQRTAAGLAINTPSPTGSSPRTVDATVDHGHALITRTLEWLAPTAKGLHALPQKLERVAMNVVELIQRLDPVSPCAQVFGTARRRMHRWGRRVARLACLSVVLGLAACTLFGPRTALHTFEFNFERDSRDFELLEWRYGDGKFWYQRDSPEGSKDGTIRQHTGVSGYTSVGTEIWAKWRERASGRVCEETARFGHALPDNMDNHIITFHIKNDRLIVLLIHQNARAQDKPHLERHTIIGISSFRFIQILSVRAQSASNVELKWESSCQTSLTTYLGSIGVLL